MSDSEDSQKKPISIAMLYGVWAFVLIVVNVLPVGNQTDVSVNLSDAWALRFDYLLHFFSFLVFAWIHLICQVLFEPRFLRLRLPVTALFFVFIAIFVEVVQIVLPYRSYNPVDLAYNFLGSLFSVALIAISRKNRSGLSNTLWRRK